MRYLLVLFGLSICLSASAQKEIQGQIFFEKDSANVTFIVYADMKFLQTGQALHTGRGYRYENPPYQREKYKVKYIDSLGVQKIIKPSMAKEIRFYYKGDRVRLISLDSKLGLDELFRRKVFVKLEIDGYLKLYHYTTGFKFQKGDDKLFTPRSTNRLINYFRDCPEMVKMIESKQFRRGIGGFPEMTRFYNSDCKY